MVQELEDLEEGEMISRVQRVHPCMGVGIYIEDRDLHPRERGEEEEQERDRRG